LKYLGISKADFFGESFGGVIATIIAVHYPELVGRVATYAATFGTPQIAVKPEILCPNLAPTPTPAASNFREKTTRKWLPILITGPRFGVRFSTFNGEGFRTKSWLQSKAPVLIALGDHDFVRLEHAIETFKLIPNAELAVIPDAGHFGLFSEHKRVIPVVKNFLEKPEKKIPFATAETGYHPGETT
jgi:pimeloyl-ACP methyl ester carboxylesterase